VIKARVLDTESRVVASVLSPGPSTVRAAVSTAPGSVVIEPYDGPYEVTPSRETQTLGTNGKQATADIVVNPIPSNYGLVTWNGAYLMIS
jgi:hypothetical protein